MDTVIATVLIAIGLLSGLLFGYLLARSNVYDDKPEKSTQKESKPKKPEAPEKITIKNILRSSPFLRQEMKMVLLVRRDLKMSKGKAAAQCSHATLGACLAAIDKPKYRSEFKTWHTMGQTKVTLSCPTLVEMEEIEEKAEKLGLNCCAIIDAGRTQIEPGSKTVLAIGPASIDSIDDLTSHFKLY
ncbi:Peptidyl-tRNA hydrolase, PTH2 like protein [Aduncisulcus paluster]|uniref:peptidyl-tRNA hydrolase n=1 Tax=Aduncisulcus paluster TaxID=2918883 RepID=A0ABQ5K6J2_9EUKA|nr:Peptidyl-tRNA hydrolase, PTH2 like protein [Aduncisulcus paluster]